MTPLRNRMIEDLQLQGYSDSTQTLYVNAVRQLCEHYDKAPGRIIEQELRDYFLYGKNVKKWARSTSPTLFTYGHVFDAKLASLSATETAQP